MYDAKDSFTNWIRVQSWFFDKILKKEGKIFLSSKPQAAMGAFSIWGQKGESHGESKDERSLVGTHVD